MPTEPTAVPWRTTSFSSVDHEPGVRADSTGDGAHGAGCQRIFPLRFSTRRIAFGTVRMPSFAKVVYAAIISSGIDVGRSDVDRRHRRNPGGDAELGGLADHRLLAQLHAELDGDDVARQVERPPHRHRALELEVVVLRGPVAARRA